MKILIFNPFEKYTEKTLILFGFSFMILGSLFGVFCNSNFDGVLDIHFSNYQLSFLELILENLINVAVMAICLFAVGKIINLKTRFIDLVSVALVSRIPIYFLSLFNVKQKLSIGQGNGLDDVMIFAQSNMSFLIVMTVVILFVLIWVFALLFNGYKIAVNAKGVKGIILFIIALIIAEIISKIIINILIL